MKFQDCKEALNLHETPAAPRDMEPNKEIRLRALAEGNPLTERAKPTILLTTVTDESGSAATELEEPASFSPRKERDDHEDLVLGASPTLSLEDLPDTTDSTVSVTVESPPTKRTIVKTREPKTFKEKQPYTEITPRRNR